MSSMSHVWFVTEETLLAMLRAVADGESPEMVYAEAFANTPMTIIGDEDEE